MMDENEFWSIIESSREKARQQNRARGEDFLDVHERTLAEALRALDPDQIAAFGARFTSLHQAAYRWDLWAAAYWLHGGCSDDGFIDFRSSLISLGKDLYHRILKNPDDLADIVDLPDTPYMQGEGFQYVAAKVYEEVTGTEMPPPESDAADSNPEPAGEQFDFEDEELMAERFPKLVAKFPEMGD